MKRVSVFCGSSSGMNSEYEEQAYMLGQVLAGRSIGLVFGGTRVGLMKMVADGALSKNGEVIGVLPRFINERGIAHRDLTRLILVETMHERKSVMHNLSEGIIALPGGFGTLEEFFEALTWGQLGLHRKPAAILNINGFYDPLNALLRKMVEQGFLKEENRKMVITGSDIEDLIDRMEHYEAPDIDKWINKNPVT
jgi:uncharacterized protein (TIGR00730 family)